MTTHTQNNPLSKRLHQMQDQWIAFEQNSTAQIGLWAITPEEYRMLSVFYEVEQTEEGRTSSLFLLFENSFKDEKSYPQELHQELISYLQEEETQKELEKIGISSKQLIQQYATASLKNYINLLQSISAQITNSGAVIVVFLNPSKNADPQKWANWVMSLLKNNSIPDKVKIMLTDLKESTIFEQAQKKHPEQFHTLIANLNMQAALQEIAAQPASDSDVNNPGILYRQAFLSLTQTASPGKLETAQQHAKKAIKIATEQDWIHLRVATYIALASVYINNKTLDQALKIYDEAVSAARKIQIPNPAFEQAIGIHIRSKEEQEFLKNNLSCRLQTQALMGKGAVCLQIPDYEQAAITYQQAATIAMQIKHQTPDSGKGDLILALEAYRMTGFSYEMNKAPYDAWDALQQALLTGEQLPEIDRKNSTLPFVGEALLRLAPKTGQKKERRLIFETLDRLVGEDWQEKTKLKIS